MDKPKIIGLSNTDDVVWYKLSPGDKTLKQLDSIFDIYDNLYDEEAKDIHSYAFHIVGGEMYFHKETKRYIVYFIFTKKTAHVILRKTLSWKEYDKEINKNFEFDK